MQLYLKTMIYIKINFRWSSNNPFYIYYRKGGVVYGAAFDNAFNLLHSRIDSVKELHKIQGTKYVQSSIGYSYKQIKNDLKSKTVLLSVHLAKLQDY